MMSLGIWLKTWFLLDFIPGLFCANTLSLQELDKGNQTTIKTMRQQLQNKYKDNIYQNGAS
jgi:hypothetical protein